MLHALQPPGLLCTFLLCFSVSPSHAVDVFRAIGEDVVLSLPLVESPIRSVQWKHNSDIAAEMYGNKVHCFPQFEGRCEMNSDTGSLTIKGLKVGDSGVYTPEINGKDSNKIELSVISRVGKPTIVKSCNMKMADYHLTCEGSTTEAEPITYKWFYDDMEGPSGKVLTLPKDKVETSFRCVMMNPVSNETSDHFKNHFIADPALVYGAKGEDMILRPTPITETIQSIVWKHKNKTAADWHGAGDEFLCFGQFDGRCEVNTSTGALTIKAMKFNDIGIYTSEINCKVYNKIQLSVISRVTKPFVGKSCNAGKTLCRLTCEGSTADAKPVTYRWLYDNMEGPSVQKILLTEYLKEDHFRCIMMNPVSIETSENIENPIKDTNPSIKRKQRDRLISIFLSVIEGFVFPVAIVFAVLINKHIRGRGDKKENGTKYELKPLNNNKVASGTQKTNLVSDAPLMRNGHSGAETGSVTPETSNQSLAEAAAPNINKETEKSSLMPDKPETNCEPSDDRGDAG